MELALPKTGGTEPQFARVTKRLHNDNDLPIEKASDNPILDTRMYKVEHSNGEKSDLSDKLID